jgi:hypothetical protein
MFGLKTFTDSFTGETPPPSKETARSMARDAGYTDGHTLGTHHGQALAETLQEAADIVYGTPFGTDPDYNRERMTYYGCELCEREPRYG